MTTTLLALVAPLEAQLRTALAALPQANRDAAKLTVALTSSDTREGVRVEINGADVTFHGDDGSADLRLTADLAIFVELMQQGSLRFVTDPIMRGKVPAIKKVRGMLRLTCKEGGDILVTFADTRKPEAVVAMSKADAIGMLVGTVNPQMAVVMGRMRIVSGMDFLMSLDRIM